MLRLLLDEHLAKAIAKQLAAKEPQIPIVTLPAWEDGDYLGADDEIILAAASEQGLTLVTYDQRTIVPLLKEWGERGISHGGMIFIDTLTLAPNNIGGLLRSLIQLWTALGEEEWRDRVVYL